MRATKKVSVITTFYNAKDFLLNAVDSVYQQLNPRKDFTIEYVIVDDHSPDESREMLENYISTHSKDYLEFKLVKPDQNLGCGGARKFGIQNATGDYFMFLDADDYYMHIDFISRAVDDIQNEGADVVEYGVVYNQPNGQKTNSCSNQKITLTNKHDIEMFMFRDNLIKFNVWSKIYQRSIVETYPYSDVRTFEDVRTIPVWLSYAKKVVIMPRLEINYRAASNSIIRTNWVDTRVGTITAIAELFPMFQGDYELLKAMYTRSMIDIEALLNGKSSECEGFNEMSKLNTYMLSYLYPDTYKNMTYNIEEKEVEEVKNAQEIPEESKEEVRSKYIKTDLNSLPGM